MTVCIHINFLIHSYKQRQKESIRNLFLSCLNYFCCQLGKAYFIHFYEQTKKLLSCCPLKFLQVYNHRCRLLSCSPEEYLLNIFQICIYIFSDYLNKYTVYCMSVQQKLILGTEAGDLLFSDIPFLGLT